MKNIWDFFFGLLFGIMAMILFHSWFHRKPDELIKSGNVSDKIIVDTPIFAHHYVDSVYYEREYTGGNGVNGSRPIHAKSKTGGKPAYTKDYKGGAGGNGGVAWLDTSYVECKTIIDRREILSIGSGWLGGNPYQPQIKLDYQFFQDSLDAIHKQIDSLKARITDLEQN